MFKGGPLQIYHLLFPARMRIVAILSTLFFSIQVNAETANMPSSKVELSLPSDLRDVLLLSLKQSSLNSNINESLSYQSSNWLATSPSVAFNYLKSQQDSGTDEIEVGINLAIKSALQRNIDTRLVELDNQIRLQQQNIRKLYFSGLIRESLWSYKIAVANQAYLQKKLSVLQQLEGNSKSLFNAGETSDYGLLLIKKELIATQIEGLENQKELQLWKSQYKTISGTSLMPDDISEPAFSLNSWSPVQHPMSSLLENRWQQNELMNKASSNEAAPWSVGISAKNIAVSGVTENQIGVSFDMPLTLIKTESQTIKNQSSQAKQQFESDYKKLVLQIERQTNQHSENTLFLLNKQKFLKNAVELSQQIMQQIDRLKAQNEFGQELILRRVMDTVKTRHEYTLTNILIEQNNAMSRQAAGISL